MATYNFDGYSPSSVQFLGGATGFADDPSAIGTRFRIDPAFDAAVDRYQYEITESGGGDQLSGDPGADEVGEDPDQVGTVRDADGNVVAGGPSTQIYGEHAYTVQAPDGSIINVYTVEVAGADMGIVTDAPLQPGVTYEILSASDIVPGDEPFYSTFAPVSYDPSANNTIRGGDLDDDLQGGGGADKIDGGGGDDRIDGGSGNDILRGDEATVERVGFKWSDLPDPDDGGQIDDEDVLASGTQTVGGVAVSFSYSGTGVNDGFEVSSDQYVAGIDGGGETVDAFSAWQIGGRHDETSQLELTFDQNVENVQFRINDIEDTADQFEQVTVRAFDADGNPVEVVIVFGSNVSGSDTDGVPGDDTGTAASDLTTTLGDEWGSMLVTVPGPVARIEIEYSDLDATGDGGLVGITDVYFDMPNAGDDTIAGGAGDDVITTDGGEDTVVVTSGGGNDTVTDFDMGDDDGDGFTNDQLDVSDLTDADGNPLQVRDVTVSDDGSGNARLTFPGGETVVLQGVSPSQLDTGAELNSVGIPCFTPGTLIETPCGMRPIETLRIGDLVLTRDNGPQPVRWIGVRRLGSVELAYNPRLRPVLIQAGAFGNDQPLLVSPQHAVLCADPDEPGGEVLMRAIHLTRLRKSRVRVAAGKRHVTYIHLLFDRHEIIFANGLSTESFYPGAWGLAGVSHANLQTLMTMFPRLACDTVERAYGPPSRRIVRFCDLAQAGRAQSVLRFAS